MSQNNDYLNAQWDDFMPNTSQAQVPYGSPASSGAPPTFPPKHMPKPGDTTKPDRIRRAWWDYLLQFIGGTCVVCVMFFLIYIGWQYIGSGMDTDSVSRDLITASKQEFKTAKTDAAQLHTDDPPIDDWKPKHGEIIGYIHLPVLNKEWKRPIQEGTDLAILNNMGAGHYENTAMPGQQGNFSLAGHATATDFGYLDRVTPGEQIIIETADNWYVYKAINHSIVNYHQTDVIAPYAAGVDRGITLTTCYPMLYWAGPGEQTQRWIVHGQLEGWLPKSEGTPEALATTTEDVQTRITKQVTKVSRQVNLPVTGVLSLSLFAIWLILDIVAWIVSHKRMIRLWQREPSANPVVWLFRLSAGNMIIRLILTSILLAAIVFLCWRWVCPWMAENIPILESPHPSIV